MPGFSEVLEEARRAVEQVEHILRECAQVRACRQAEPTLKLEAWTPEPGYPGEPVEPESGAKLVIEPSLSGEELLELLGWVQERVGVVLVAGEGENVSLTLEAGGELAPALETLEDIANTIAGLMGPGITVSIHGRLNEEGQPRWSLLLARCYDKPSTLAEAATAGARAMLSLCKSLRGLETTSLEDVKVEVEVDEPGVCAGLLIGLG